jgi:DNA mismatch repair protein MutH
VDPPRDEAELSARLARLSDRSLASIAGGLGLPMPPDLRRHKGWAGQLIEQALGATAASRAEPDFPALGIELKTVPVGARGRPLESTFVASLDLGAFDRRWETSGVRKKLRRVAWVAIEGDKDLPLAQRRCRAGFIWSPTAAEEAALRSDYDDIVELIDEGFGAHVTAHRGTFLQLRPKGANAAALRWALDEEGASVRTSPRAFYLRAGFTETVLRAHPLAQDAT